MRVAVTGATGFLGRHLLARLIREGVSVRILTRRPEVVELPREIEIVKGDLRDREAVRRLLQDADHVAHLAYPEDVSDHESGLIVEMLAEEALASGVQRFIHVSTAVVVGLVGDAIIDEETRPSPQSAYQRRKLRIEQILQEKIGEKALLSILRPTAVFGSGGQGLLKLAADLQRDPFILRAARRALLRSRRLNLVCVDNVSESIWFAATAPNGALRGCFIVSDDDAPENNFGDVSAFLAERLAVRVPAVPDLTPLLPPLLRLRGRSMFNPYSVFSPRKLLAAGFRRAVSFAEGLDRFAIWYQSHREKITA